MDEGRRYGDFNLLAVVSKFTNESGARLTKGLFYEMTMADKSSVLYTLKNQDHKGFPSLYALYMSEMDPTEYRFAIRYLEGWEHWKQLTACTWFMPFADKWREELQLKLSSEALFRIMTEAKADRKEAFAANKYLLEKGWVPKGQADKVGRPSKEAIRDQARKMVQDNTRIFDDWKRISPVQTDC